MNMSIYIYICTYVERDTPYTPIKVVGLGVHARGFYC